jgi:hypothetical protein
MATANLSSVDILPAANRAPFVARLSQSIVDVVPLIGTP